MPTTRATADRQRRRFDELAPSLQVTRAVFDDIARTVGRAPAETGGMLGISAGQETVDRFMFDDDATVSGATYSPNHRRLSQLLEQEWNPQGIRLAGFVHSHPRGCPSPSSGDRAYAEQFFSAIDDLERFYIPIVMSAASGGDFDLRPFVATRGRGDVRIYQLALDIVDDVADDTFDRVREVYDLERLARSRVVAIGAGGAASFIEDLARAGVGEFVLVDPDHVSRTNLATQQTYRRDVGRLKTECIRDRLLDINPAARVVSVPVGVDDIDDARLRQLVTGPLQGGRPGVSLLCGLTDDFYAQARVNRAALDLGVPSLCAQVYREGRGAEITFTYPGLTPACHRCILSSRYRAYLEGAFQNDVTSAGTPIFATTRLNALKGFVALAILHHGMDPGAPAFERFGTLLSRIGNRNLIQIRMDPDLAANLGLDVFDRVLKTGDAQRVLFDETLWLPQEQEGVATGYEPCGDCGGTGDLRASIGRLGTTRLPLQR